MPDWTNLSDWGWLTPDLGIGAVVGAVITAAVALLIDHRRRLDESKNRFSEEKLRAYEHVISRLDNLGQMLLLVAEFAPLLRKMDSGEDLTEEDAQARQSLLERLDRMREKYDTHAGEEAILKLSLLSSGASVRASCRLMKVMLKMGAYFDSGNYEKVGKLSLRYEFATADFLIAAQRDLGIRA